MGRKKDYNTKVEYPSFSSTVFQLKDVYNGLFLKFKYIPEEVILHILSFVEPSELLNYCLVCKKWNKLIKSFVLWSMIYLRKYNRRAKKLPWYLYYCLLSTNYFDINLLINGNGQCSLNNWKCKIWDGDKYIEEKPIGANPLPLNIPEFNHHLSCFATTYFSGYKMQLVKITKNKLFHYILDNYKPHISVSEWTTARTDCGCIYKLQCGFTRKNCNIPIMKPYITYHKLQWQEGKWEKMELLITEYPERIDGITFENEGHNTQTWKKHYGCKMAGGVVKFLFESIEPLVIDEYGNTKPKIFSKIKFTANGLSQEQVIDYCLENYLWNQEDEDEHYFMLP